MFHTLNLSNYYFLLISARNPPPLCFPVIQFPGLVICAYLTDVVIEPNRFQVCLNVQFMIGPVPLLKFNFDCIEFTPDKGLQVMNIRFLLCRFVSLIIFIFLFILGG